MFARRVPLYIFVFWDRYSLIKVRFRDSSYSCTMQVLVEIAKQGKGFDLGASIRDLAEVGRHPTVS